MVATAGIFFMFGALASLCCQIEVLFHLPTLAIVLGLCFFMLLGSYGMEFLKFIPASLMCFASTPSRPEPRYAEIAKFGSRYVIAGAVICSVISVIGMLANLSRWYEWGHAAMVYMIAPFYAVLISELFFAFVYIAFSDSGPAAVRKERAGGE